MLVFMAFIGLVMVTAWRGKAQKTLPYQAKPLEDWILDGAGLCVQGMVIPLLQVTVVYQGCAWLLPGWEDQLRVGAIAPFFMSVVGIDYLYYWNHRWLHHRRCWFIHQVHHTVTQMDVLGTSRNTLWSSFFIVYLWGHALMIYMLDDPRAYLLGVSLSSALDLWRHSSIYPPPHHWLYRMLNAVLIMPLDHAQHHSRHIHNCNFGANLKLWDKLHGTYRPNFDTKIGSTAEELGIDLKVPILRKLIAPFPRKNA